MMKTSWRRLTLWSVLAVSGLLTACGGRSISFLVTRPAEINLSEYDRITIGDIRGSGGGFVAKLGDFGKFLQGVESKDTWARKLSAEMAQAIAHSGRFELLDYENLKIGRGPVDAVGSTVLISGGILAYDYDEEESGEDVEKTGKKTNKKTESRQYAFRGTARVEVQLRIVDLSTSKILATRSFAEREIIKKSDKALARARIDNADRRRLFAKCRADIVRSLERMIVPYTERVYVSFETDKGLPELERGFRMVQAGSWDAALEIFQTATEIHSGSPRGPQGILQSRVELPVYGPVRPGARCASGSQWQKVECEIQKRHP